MRRADIPVRLRTTRAADCAKIPDAALAKMTPADVETRLQAADEFRRRAAVPHLDGDLLRGRLALAREVLTTPDPKRATALAKAAGVPSYTLRDGTKVPTGDAHELAAAIGRAKADHLTGQPGDDPGFRRHLIGRAAALNQRAAIPQSWAHEAAGKSTVAKAGRAPARLSAGTRYGRLAKAAAPARPGRSVTVLTPALDIVSRSKSLEDGLTTLQRKGYLGLAAKELAAVAAASAEVRGEAGSASYYAAKARQVTDPADRAAYQELARQQVHL